MKKRSEKKLSNAETWQYHAYNYGWLRVIINEDHSQIDPQRLWFNDGLVRQSEAMWRKFFNKPLPRPHAPVPSADDVAHAEVVANRARSEIQAEIAKFKRKHAGDRPQHRYVTDKADIAELQRKLGIVARPSDHA